MREVSRVADKRLVTIDFGSFGLGDQTFVRNTGNFTHAFVGEGGSNIELSSARVFAYSAKKQLISQANSCTMGGAFGIPESGTDDQDFGMSPGVHVSDFISNTGVHVVSIATNFNGLTNLVRDRKSTRLNSSHGYISYAVFCLKKKKKQYRNIPETDTRP